MSFKETYNIDASQAERALKSLADANKRLEDGTAAVTKGLSAEDKAARRIAEAADPMKKFNRQQEELAVLVNKGKVSLEEAAVVAAKYQQRLDHASKSGEMAFGQRAVSQLASYAAGFVSMQAGISIVQGLFATMRQEADAAAERIKASLDALGELQQIEGFTENRKFVDELRKRGVVKDASQGANLANALDQAGFNEEEQKFIAFDLIRSRFLDANSGADVATKFAKVNDLLQIGDLRTTVNKIVQAGGSTSSTNPEFADALTVFAGQFKDLGFNADESMAALEIADKNSKNILSAAERLKSFGDQVTKRGLSTGDFLGTVNAIRAREQAGENIFAILGEANAVAGYKLFDEQREQDKYRKSMGLVATASQRDVLGQQLGGIYKDPQLAAAINAQAAKGALEVEQEERRGELNLLFEEATNAKKLYEERRGSRFGSASSTFFAGLAQAFGGERGALEASLATEFHRGDRGDGGFFSKDFEDRLLSYLERTANNTEQQPKPSAE